MYPIILILRRKGMNKMDMCNILRKKIYPDKIIRTKNVAATLLWVGLCTLLPGAYVPGYKNSGATRLARW
ncbi:MAG: hypothetical protein LBT25_08070 [Candidatus Symbiothrix sp.]|jgi:hypothetical protein|nr:hypothetical protein [Candidatus Symbiothrix sp.]